MCLSQTTETVVEYCFLTPSENLCPTHTYLLASLGLTSAVVFELCFLPISFFNVDFL